MTKDIEMIKTSYKLNSNNEYEVEEQEARMIDDEWYNNIIEAKQFFLNLGGARDTQEETNKERKKSCSSDQH